MEKNGRWITTKTGKHIFIEDEADRRERQIKEREEQTKKLTAEKNNDFSSEIKGTLDMSEKGFDDMEKKDSALYALFHKMSDAGYEHGDKDFDRVSKAYAQNKKRLFDTAQGVDGIVDELSEKVSEPSGLLTYNIGSRIRKLCKEQGITDSAEVQKLERKALDAFTDKLDKKVKGSKALGEKLTGHERVSIIKAGRKPALIYSDGKPQVGRSESTAVCGGRVFGITHFSGDNSTPGYYSVYEYFPGTDKETIFVGRFSTPKYFGNSVQSILDSIMKKG